MGASALKRAHTIVSGVLVCSNIQESACQDRVHGAESSDATNIFV